MDKYPVSNALRQFWERLCARFRLGGLWGAFPFAVIISVRALAIWTSTPRQLAAYTPDDAYYYFGIARSLASGLGSTFDGITLTNGYQPLWLLVCTFLSWVAGVESTDPETWALLPRVALTLQILLGCFAIGLIARGVKRATGSRSAEMLVWLGACNPWTVYCLCDGMESGIVLLTLAWFVLEFIEFVSEKGGPLGGLRLGAALALALLARLDLALLVPLTVLSIWRRTSWRGRWGVVGPPCVAAALYLLINALIFDSLLPISALLKGSWPWWGGRTLTWLMMYPFQVALALSVGALGFATRWHSTLSTPFVHLARVGGLFVLLHLFHTLIFLRGHVWKWHFASYYAFALWILPLWWHSKSRRDGGVRQLVVVSLVGLVLGVAAQAMYFHRRTNWAFQSTQHDVAQELRERTDPHQIVAVFDGGVLGYYRGGRVFVMDGLTVDRAYQDDLRELGLAGALETRNVSLVGIRFPGRDLPRGYGTFPLHYTYPLLNAGGRPLSPLPLEESREVFRVNRLGPEFGAGRTLVFWRFP